MRWKIGVSHESHRRYAFGRGCVRFLLLLFSAFFSLASQAAVTITGTVFEDVNYGGGAGRSMAASGGTPLAGVRVELWRVSNNSLVDTAITNASGAYTLNPTGTNTTQASPHIVRVVNGTVRSSRNTACTTCVGIQTYRTNASSGAPVAVTDHVGGEAPNLVDAPSSSLASSATQTPQSITTVDPTSSSATITGVDFGFNFDTVVNINDAASCTPITGSPATVYPCQGSLRQFIINANALGSASFLSQNGSGQIDGLSSSLPSGFESSIFMIPNGVANAGQNSGFSNQLTGGVAIISLATTLTVTSSSNVRLDATTQTVNVGNTNSGTLGSGGTVGVDAIFLPTFQRAEVQINGANTAITLNGASDQILGFALNQSFIVIAGSSGLARNNLVGMTATGDSSANTSGIGIAFQGTSATVRNNFVTVNNSAIRTDNGGAGSVITLNEVARPTSGHTNTFDGILLVGTVSNTQVTANLTRDQAGGGIEVGFGGGAAATNIIVSNNTVRNNGFSSGSTPSTEPLGMAAYAYAGSGVVFSRNVVRDNAGAGIMVMAANGTQISQNSFMNNGGLSIDLDNRNVDPNSMNTVEGVTLNDNGDTDSGPNGLRNYPVIANAIIIGSELLISGYARPGSNIELYIAQADPTGFGEGITYLTTLTEGSAADLDATTGTYGPAAINGLLQGTDTTNKFVFRIPTPGGVAIGTRLSSTATLSGETSEFGGNVVVTGGPTLVHQKTVAVFSDPINGVTNPKSIPGAFENYTLKITNQGAGAIDNNTVAVIDAVPANTKLFVGDFGIAGSGPIAFTNGAPSSGLTYTYTALNSTTDDVDFSNDGGVTWLYVPTLDTDSCDANVTHIRIRPKGVMPGNSGGNPYFNLQFRVRLK